jgi:CDP-diacylglycerol--glycerol-3-phosphate 3-phosphatidyltransferase
MLSLAQSVHEPAELAHGHAHLPRAVARGRVADEGRQILGVPTEFVGAAIFGLASLTDWADGYLARRRKQITPFGQFIDPLADKLLTLAALVSLVQMDLAPAWMVAVIIGREFAVTALRSLIYARGVAIPASSLGKMKMIAQVVAILALILSSAGEAAELLWWVGQAALWIVVVAALASAADYFRRFGLFTRHDVIARDDRVA